MEGDEEGKGDEVVLTREFDSVQLETTAAAAAVEKDEKKDKSSPEQSRQKNLDTEESSSKEMTGKILGFTSRKNGSPVHSSTENSPLLNGSESVTRPYYSSTVETSREDTIEQNLFRTDSPSSDSSDGEQMRLMWEFLCKIKVTIFVGVLVFALVALSFITVDVDEDWTPIAISASQPASINLTVDSSVKNAVVHLKILGDVLPTAFLNYSDEFVVFLLARTFENGTYYPIISPWEVPVAPEGYAQEVGATLLEYDFFTLDEEFSDDSNYQLMIMTSKKEGFVFLSVDMFLQTEFNKTEIFVGLAVLIILYILLIFELLHKTLATLIAAIASIALLSFYIKTPFPQEVLSWVDIETLALIIGMMVLVSALCESGFFEFIAAQTYKAARGTTWLLIIGMCLLTVIFSAAFGNIIAVMLMTAFTIRLSDVMNVRVEKMLVIMVIFSNIGGGLTPFGCLSNEIIIMNQDFVRDSGITYGVFTLHMLPAICMALISACTFIRLLHKSPSSLRYLEPPEVNEIKREIEVWRSTNSSLSCYTKEENTVKAIIKRKICVLETLLRKKLYDTKASEDEYATSFKEFGSTYKIRDLSLLIKTAVMLCIVLAFSIVENAADINFSVGWAAVLCATTLILLADFQQLDSIFSRFEWSTLIFYSSFYVVIEVLTRMKILPYIAKVMQDAIISADSSHRLLVAIIIIVWVTALASTAFNNVPVSSIMVQTIIGIANDQSLNLPLAPMIYALALGTSFGGNGALLSASVNLVSSGISEHHCQKVSFISFCKIGFPVMVLTTILSMSYLLLCHVVGNWS